MSQLRRRTLALAPRLLGVFGALVAFALVATFMSVPFLVRREPAPLGQYQLGEVTVSPDVKVFPNGTYLLTLAFKDRAGEPVDAQPVSVTVRMAGMDGNPQELNRVSAGLYRGAGLFAMPGRWMFTLRMAGGSVEIPAGSPGAFHASP